MIFLFLRCDCGEWLAKNDTIIVNVVVNDNKMFCLLKRIRLVVLIIIDIVVVTMGRLSPGKFPFFFQEWHL